MMKSWIIGVLCAGLTVPTVLHLFATPVCAGESYGSRGTNGSNGDDGRNGQDGNSQTIFANGDRLYLNLSGQDGESGESGRDGRDAYCYSQPRSVRNDLQAPDGGDGGDGGNGGNGGNGGDLTVYYLDPEALRQIQVLASGGAAGWAGSGGYAGQGCNCQVRYWQVRVCHGNPGSAGYYCDYEDYECEDGDDGDPGRSGQAGNPGRMGRLTLIQQQETLAPDNPTAILAMTALDDQPIALSRNLWETRYGALSLLAPGSIIADAYEVFIGRAERSVDVVWNAERPLTEFAGESATVELVNAQDVTITFPEEVWVEGSLSYEGTMTRFTAEHVVLEDEATQLSVADLAGENSTLTFALVDLASKSDLVDTQFEIRYESTDDPFGDRARYSMRYEGAIPDNLITQDFNRFTIDLGRLPIDPRYLRSGIRVELEITATRSFGGRSAEQEIDWRGQI